MVRADDDARLVEQARGGDYTAFEALVTKYQRRLYNLALRMVHRRADAEEVVQQTFVSLIEHLDSFREEARFYTWIVRIATNHALTLLRRNAARPSVSLDEDQLGGASGDLPRPDYIAQWRETPEEIASRHETTRMLHEALGELDEKYRLVFVLRDVEGLSTQETAEALAISVSNVKVRLLRARLMLRERLTRVFGDEATRLQPDPTHGSS